MNHISELNQSIGDVDIYLIDQILKGRYKEGESILDAGCGTGRNLKWFKQHQFSIYGIDTDPVTIEFLKERWRERTAVFKVSDLAQLQFPSQFFDHVIASAVLHFAKNEIHFYAMVSQLVRVLKPKGSLFVRMASNFGMTEDVPEIANGIYALPDGSQRFLLTENLLKKITSDHSLGLIDPIKTTNVENRRWMTTLVFQKE